MRNPVTKTLMVFAVIASLLAVAQPVLGHGEDDHGGPAPREEWAPQQGRNPGDLLQVPYYSYYQGGWMYGSSEVATFEHHFIQHMRVSGEWLTWDDAERGDIYAYNLAAGDGFYLTNDQALQQRPDIHDGVVVWEDKRTGPSDILAYFLDTGELRRVTHGLSTLSSATRPSVYGNWVTWEDDREEEQAVYAFDMLANQELLVAHEPGVENTEPVMIGSTVVYRTYRFNVYDLKWFDVMTGESGSVTADRFMEQAPFRAGDRIMFLKQSERGWLLHEWDPVKRVTKNTGIYMLSPNPPAADGDYVVTPTVDSLRASFMARNLTNGAATRISGYLPAMDFPVMQDKTLFMPVWNGTDAAIVTLDINPRAFLNAPVLFVENPDDGAIVRGGSQRVSGSLSFKGTWGTPDSFVYSVNGQNYTEIFPAPDWSFTLDFKDKPPGLYEVSVEAHYSDAPTIIETFELVQPAAFRGTDIQQAGDEFHAMRIYGLYYRYVESNPAIVALAAIAAVVLALFWLKWRLTRTPIRRSVIEYIEPDEA